MDGKAYHANEHKEFVELKGDELTPYATVTKFKADTTYQTKINHLKTFLTKLKKTC